MSDFMLALPGIIFWIVVIFVIKSAKSKTGPKNNAERELVHDVISTIERFAPDFDGATVSISSEGSVGGIKFVSLSGQNFSYDYATHGYFVSDHMARLLAAEIAKRFGGESCQVSRYDLTVAYRVIGPRQLAAEREKKRREDSLKHL